jgi:hypothetical protein
MMKANVPAKPSPSSERRITMLDKFTIHLTDKPAISKLLEENPKLGKEVIGLFVSLIEESAQKGWATLPGEFHKDLSFSDLVRGILRGSLDLPDINPDAYDALKAEVHPLALLSPRKNYLDGGVKLYNWRNHFKLPEGTTVSEETVASIFRKLLRYGKYIKIEELAKALEANQLTTFRGLGERSVELLPMVPALRYQQRTKGDLAVGKFFDEIGFLDCGIIPEDFKEFEMCPACEHPSLTMLGHHAVCLNCNAGFVV